MPFEQFTNNFLNSYNNAQANYQRYLQAQAQQRQAEEKAREQRIKRAFDVGPQLWRLSLKREDEGLPWRKDVIENSFFSTYGKDFEDIGLDNSMVAGLMEQLAGNPRMTRALTAGFNSGQLTAGQAVQQLANAGATPEGLNRFTQVLEGISSADRERLGIISDELGIQETSLDIARKELDLQNRSVRPEVLTYLKERFGIDNWNDALPAQKAAAFSHVGRVAIWDSIDGPVKRSLIASGVTAENLQPQAVDSAINLVAQAEATQASLNTEATLAGRRRAELGRPVTAQDASVLAPWVQEFQRRNGRQPTYQDVEQAGITIPDQTISRELLRRRSGVSDVVEITDRLIEQVNKTGPGFRGFPAFLARTFSNFRASTEGFLELINVFDSDDKAMLNHLEKTLVEDQDAFSELTEQSEAVRVLTIQMAYALAKAEGQEGRAITASILKERYIPQAAGMINDPEIAIQRLQQVAFGAVRRYNTYQAQVLGPSMPAFVPQFLPLATETFDDPNPVRSEPFDIQELQSLIQEKRAKYPEVFQ